MNFDFAIPIAVLVLWTSVMLYWMIALRWPTALKMYGPADTPKGFRGMDLEGEVPDRIMWPSHNYTNLAEQPTIFYAIAIVHGLIGSAMFDLYLVWAYVILRILHSIWQAAVNIVLLRTILFMLSDVIVVILAVRVLMTAFA